MQGAFSACCSSVNLRAKSSNSARTSEGVDKLMVVDENIVRDHMVKLGQEFGGRTRVLEGLKAVKRSE